MLRNDHCTLPRLMGIDKSAAYLSAFEKLQEEGIIPEKTKLRQVKYLNNILEQDHRPTKKKKCPANLSQSGATALVLKTFTVFRRIYKDLDLFVFLILTRLSFLATLNLECSLPQLFTVAASSSLKPILGNQLQRTFLHLL